MENPESIVTTVDTHNDDSVTPDTSGTGDHAQTNDEAIPINTEARNGAATTVVNPDTSNQDDSSCLHRGNCCLKTKRFLESSSFSFTLGVLLFIVGVCLIGVTSNMEANNFFLIGPFSLAAGTILLIRGCINELAKRQQVTEEAEREERQRQGHLTREERVSHPSETARLTRTERYEAAALSAENLIIPPPYDEAVQPKTTAPLTATVGSQANFSNSLPTPALHNISTQASYSNMRRLQSIQSQTSFASMVDIGVDTSDLPTDLDSTSLAPPSYDAALSPSNLIDIQGESSAELSSSQSVTVYIPTE